MFGDRPTAAHLLLPAAEIIKICRVGMAYDHETDCVLQPAMPGMQLVAAVGILNCGCHLK